MQANGLIVRAPDGEIRVRPRLAADPAELGPQDAVLVCTKVPALGSVARAIGPLLGPETPVAFVTNGIPWWYYASHGGAEEGRRVPEADPGDLVWDLVGPARAIGGVIYSACAQPEPGVTQVASASSKLIIGEPDNTRSDRALALAGLFKAGGLPCSVSEKIRVEVWAKLLNNLLSGPICSLNRRTMRDSLADPVVRAAATQLVEEGIAIAAAMGQPIPGGAPERIEMAAQIHHKPSILQDLEAGRPMEVDALFQVPLRLAREKGVPAPMLALTVALMAQVAEAAGLYQPAEGAGPLRPAA
ncbi:ketopantoate reductase family protein [Dankookia sp. P2]|uniref:ketopantoate reductase family protein n=1 Tax=Dankookia sp. P2 TaxID=3423955 RepID=UPI003D67D039